ncbi:MAG TPA: uracil-DNA glycosylase [Oligoflexia bacterium]|nr:uracil-DNA glycosylase [Oligoflexia bacterium]HMP49833.1 uracil-DNA glycosylase [Oligoflexia bacterium]
MEKKPEINSEEFYNQLLDSAEFYLKYSGLSHIPKNLIQPRDSLSHDMLPEPDSIKKAFPEACFSNKSLDFVKSEAMSCTSCRLHEFRKNVVFESGNRNKPLIAFVGEGPGEDEDIQGVPFVGKAGELLTAAITKGLKLKREDVYICNVIKCRPPKNRAPLPDEVEACFRFLEKQLETVLPKVIVTLGGPAQKALIGRDEGITKLRGRWCEWRGIKVMPTVHPAYVLRKPEAKKDFWADLQLVMKELNLS